MMIKLYKKNITATIYRAIAIKKTFHHSKRDIREETAKIPKSLIGM